MTRRGRPGPRITSARRIRTHGIWVTVAVTTNDPVHPAYELDMTPEQYVRTVLLIEERNWAPIPTGENV